ncbi:MAG TPA: ABC transporter substrate-binding protein [Myxococcaceae bacterium]|nr:ABC transporter substrate-binding protein [Myxococcaceae bacterium]
MTGPRTLLQTLSLACLGFASPLALAAAPPSPATPAQTVAAAEKEGKLIVYSTTDSAAAGPLLKDFAALYPKINVEYSDMNSTEIYNRFVSEAAAGSGTADLLWSSAMDLQIKLANDGYAMAYQSPEAAHLPTWAVWKGEAFGTTFEPIAFVYNKRLLKAEEVPQSHAEFVKLLKANTERFKGKVTSYDPERSGIGFLLITQDARTDPSFAETMKTYGKVGVKLYTSTGAMMERIQSGEHLIGFNMIGSYAIAKQKKDPNLAIAYPKDYMLVMSRIAVIPKAAKHANAAKVFLDYLLSIRGQEIIANKAALFSIRPEVQGETTMAALEKTMGSSLKPIPVSPSLLVYLDQSKRLEFLKQWQEALGTK